MAGTCSHSRRSVEIATSSSSASDVGQVGPAPPQQLAERPRIVGGRLGGVDEVVEQRHEAVRVVVVGEVAGAGEDLEAAAGHGGVGHLGVADRDDAVVVAPDDQRRHGLGQVAAVEHGDDLAPPVDRRAERADRTQCGPIRYAINGLLSLTPDGSPILGETPEVAGLWSAAAVWIKEGPGVGRAVAELMTYGHSEIDISHSDIARFYPHQRTRAHVRARTAEAFNKTYGIIHPGEQYESDRNQRLAPMHASQRELGAVFFEAAGWERPFWYESNAGLLEEYGERVMPRAHEWDARWWSPIINAEHLRMRETAGIVDLSAFCVFDVVGHGALATVQRACVAQCDVAPGRVVYTPVLDAKGGFVSDLTVMRLAHDRFRVVTGGAHGMVDKKWFTDLAEDAAVVDLTSSYTTIGVWGPRARDIVSSLTRDDVSHEAFGFGTCREIELDSLTVLASRISYVGELGWELYVPIEQGARLWTMLHQAGGRTWRDPGRHRRLRHHRPDREGLPRLRVRAGRRALHRRGGHAATQGQDRGLRGQGGLRQAARGSSRPPYCAR